MLEVYVSNVLAISNVCWKCFIFHLGWDGRSHVAPLVMQTLDFTQSTPSPREAVRSLNVRALGGNVRSSSRSREQVFVLLNCCYFIVMLSNLKFFVSFFMTPTDCME